MVNTIPRKAKRITASFLAVCVFAMAVLPYGNISFADTFEDNTSTSSGSKDTTIDITIPANEKLVIGTEKGTITTVDEPSSTEPTTEPSNEEGKTEPTTEPNNEESKTEPMTEPNNEEGKTEPTTEPNNEESKTEPTTEPNNEESKTEATTEPNNEEGKTEPTTEPNNEEGKTEITTEPNNEEGKTGPTTEPNNEESKTEPTTEPSNEESKTEPSNEEPSAEPSNKETLTEIKEDETSIDSQQGNNTILKAPILRTPQQEQTEPKIEVSGVKVLRNNEEIKNGYAKSQDTIVLEYTAIDCSEALKVTFNGKEYVLKDLTEDTEIILKSLGENKYSISKVLKDEDTAGPIEFKFEDGNMQWNVDTKITYDNSLPTFVFNIEYGNLATGVATINGTPKDNNNIEDVSIYINGAWESINGVKNGETFKYAIAEKGTYKFRITDVAGNSIEKDTIVENGNEGMIVKKLPNKTTYLKNEEISLEGGYLKITNTFGETVTTDPNTVLVCFCDEGCDCAVDGVCDPDNGCQNFDYVIPMTLATISSIKEVRIEGTETIKEVTLAYDIYKPTFEIIEKDINKYNITMTPNSGEITDDTSIVVGVQVTKLVPDAADITKKYYTWSTMPDNLGNEVYEATFMGDVQNEKEPTEVVSDGIFTYTNILTADGNNVDSGKHWRYDAANGMYRSEYIGYGKSDSEITSQKRITINSNDTEGIISFEYMTNSPSGDLLKVSINGEEVLSRDGKYSWKTFSKRFSASDKTYVIDLNFTRSGVTSGNSNNYVAIRNLTFTGEKQWKELNGDTVTLLSENAVGKNNYLYIKVINEDGESSIAFSGNFEYQSVLEGISIDTVPNNTVYYYTKEDDSKPGQHLISTDSIVTGGAITLKYNKGTTKIPMSIIDSDNQEVLNENVSVSARPLKSSEDGVLKNNVWYKNINLNYPGVWDVKVEYGDDGSGVFSDYYTITINYNKADGKAILDGRDVKVNSPELIDGMVPVKWIEVTRDGKTEGFWVTTTEYDHEWYDYSAGARLWANVMLKDEIEIREVTNPKDKTLALNNLAGKRIDAYGSMFVWVPRFAYAINTGANSDAFPFLVSWSNGTVDETDYYQLPAFTYGGKDLTGFWMAKYEASNNGVIEIKPDRMSGFEGITVEDAYDYSKNMFENNSSEYGINEDAVSHLVTMAEWDAISILTMSEEQYAMSPRPNAFYNRNGKDPYTGYNSNEMVVELDADANSSTTYNMSGIFDMHGGAPEIVSVVFDSSNTNLDVDIFDSYDTISMSNWLMSKLYEEGLWEDGSEEIFLGSFYSNFILEEYADVVVRGYSDDGGTTDGIFNTYILTNDTLEGIPSVGFRPTILVAERNDASEVKIASEVLSIKTYVDGVLQDKGQGIIHAGVGDVIYLTLKATNDEINVKDVLINGKAPTSSIPALGSAANEWIFTYRVGQNDPNGKVEVSYKYKVHGDGEEQYKDGPNNVNTVYVDTTPGDADIGLSNDKKKIEITVIAGNEEDSGVKVIKVTKREDGEEAPGSDFFGDGGENVDLGDGGKGTVDITGPGTYYIYIEDEAGNVIIKQVTITSGTGEGEYDINDTIPKLEEMILSVLKDTEYVTDVEYVKRLETIKLDMTFDKELTVGPTVNILGEKAVVSGNESDKKLWTAICNRVGNQYAYMDIPITISDYEYYGNKGEIVIESFDDVKEDGSAGVLIPYDGSLVKIEVGKPTLLNKNGETWEEVNSLDPTKPMALEYVVTFSDPVYTRESIVKTGMSNLDTSSINISSSDVTINTDGMTADITVNTFIDPDTNFEVLEKRVLRFENITGEGRFGFSIAGAKYSDDLASVTNYVAQDKYGNPNEQFATGGAGDANAPMIDTSPPVLTNVSIYSDGENPKYAKNGDTITVKFAVSEELGTLPAITIFQNEVEVNYVDGYYIAEYLIPSDAEYTEGIIPFSVSNYKDKVGNTGNAFTQDNLESFENVIYDITAPVVTIDPNGGEFSTVEVNVTLTDSPAGIKGSILKYCWNTEAAEPEIAEDEWSLVAISGNSAVISSPTGLNESRYLIIKGVYDNSGNVSNTFISNEFIFSNAYEVIITTSPDTVIDDSDPDNIITTPGVVTGGGEYNPGESVTITATPADGYRFDKWVINGVDGFADLTLLEQSFTMPKSNVWASANFVKLWTVVFKSYDGEILSTQVVDNGSAAIAPTAPSRSGYSFTGWEPTPSDANFLNVNCDMELVATYSRKTYTITAYAGSNGTISPAGSVSVSYGANKRFNISPNNGYKILDVIVDGVSVGAVNTYLFEDVTSNHTIHVTFTEDVRYELEGEWYYDNIELVANSPEYVFRSRETLDAKEDASAIVIVRTLSSVNVSFEYILNARDDAMFGITINGKPLRRVIESTDIWTEFNETVEPVDGKIVIGLTYSKGENPTADESFLDLAAIKNLEVE